MANFTKFKIGTVFNPIKTKYKNVSPKSKRVLIQFPSRLNAMAIDPSKIVKNKNMVFSPGEIVFSIKIYNQVEVKTTTRNKEILISERSKRKSLIQHSVILMRKALNVQDGLYLDVNNKSELKHSGLGSSSALIASVATAINELYGKPISAQSLVKYLAQNHGEEIETDDKYIQQVQCIGGSAASGLFKGGLLVLAGDSQVIKTMQVPYSYKAVIGIPLNYIPQDSEVLMKLEEQCLSRFLRTGKKYGKEIAYRVLHEALPGMCEADLKPIGNLIFDYRFKMGSIENCSFVYPPIIEISKKLYSLERNKVTPVLSLSSVGPAFFAITKNTKAVSNNFKSVGLKTIVSELENNKYKVLERES